MKNEATLLLKSVGSTPKADGLIRDVIEARQAGRMPSIEAARWLLEVATKRSLIDAHTTAKIRYATSRKSKIEKDDTSRLLFEWMVTFKRLAPATARQYVLRIQKLAEQGYLNESVEDAIAFIRAGKDEWPNGRQCLAALMLYQQFQGDQVDTTCD